MKQNKILYSIAKNSGSRRELKKIKKIKDKDSRKCYNYSSDSSIDESYSVSSLSRDSDWYEDIQPVGHRDVNRFDQVVTNNVNTNKDKHNDAIDNEPTFDTDRFNLSSET